MSDDVTNDFARLHETAQTGASGLGVKTHPLFGAAHSMILAQKYGKADPYTYMNSPGLRAMDTRQAALEGMRTAGGTVRRASDMYRPSIPGPVPPMPGPTTSAPEMPSPAKFTKRTYSQPTSPPGTVQ